MVLSLTIQIILDATPANAITACYLRTDTEDRDEEVSLGITNVEDKGIQCEKGPKFEVEGSAEIEVNFGEFSNAKLKANGKGTFAVETCYTLREITETKEKRKYQKKIEVIGEELWLWGFGKTCTDYMHADKHGPWTLLSANQFSTTHIEKLNPTHRLVDPPGQAPSVEPIPLYTGQLLTDFDYLKTMSIPLDDGTFASVNAYKVYLDGKETDSKAKIEVGNAPLTEGLHELVIETDIKSSYGPGKMTFTFPINITPPLEFYTDNQHVIGYDESYTLNLKVKNHDSVKRTVTLSLPAPEGWTIGAPVNPLELLPNSEANLQIPIHTYPMEQQQIVNMIITGKSDADTITTSTTLIAQFPYSKLLEFERQIMDSEKKFGEEGGNLESANPNALSADSSWFFMLLVGLVIGILVTYFSVKKK